MERERTEPAIADVPAGEQGGVGDERFMREAIFEAERAAAASEVPVGAVVVYKGAIIARAHNRRELDEDPSAHAEFAAMLEASRVLGRWRLTGCTVYVTLEPCLMCAGLMVNSRIDRCVFGAADPKAGATGTLYHVNNDPRLNHSFEVTAGVLADECAQLLASFFARLRTGERACGDAHDEKHARVEKTYAREGVRARGEERAPRVLLAIDAFKGSAARGDSAVCAVPAMNIDPSVGAASTVSTGSAASAVRVGAASVTSAEVEEWVAEGVTRACPRARVTALPVADGGAGTVQALHAALGGEIITASVRGSLGEAVQASYLLADGAGGAFAAIEVAEVAGIERFPLTHEAAMRASTYGVGELLLDALARGARTVYFAVGDGTTNDGGAGFLQAIGAKLLDAQGDPIVPGLAGLRDVEHIDLRDACAALGSCEVVVLSDADIPLVGARGALKMHGAQKGLLAPDHAEAPDSGIGAAAYVDTMAHAGSDRLDLDAYDRWMIAYGRALDSARHALDTEHGVFEAERRAERGGRPHFASVLGVPGAGAAGGLGAAMLALGARLTPGASAVLDLIGFDEALSTADVLITGEGFMGERVARGKISASAAARAKRRHVPVIAVVGARTDTLGDAYQAGIDLVLPAIRCPMALEQALSPEEMRANLRTAGEAAIRAYLLRSW